MRRLRVYDAKWNFLRLVPRKEKLLAAFLVVVVVVVVCYLLLLLLQQVQVVVDVVVVVVFRMYQFTIYNLHLCLYLLL